MVKGCRSFNFFNLNFFKSLCVSLCLFVWKQCDLELLVRWEIFFSCSFFAPFQSFVVQYFPNAQQCGDGKLQGCVMFGGETKWI